MQRKAFGSPNFQVPGQPQTRGTVGSPGVPITNTTGKTVKPTPAPAQKQPTATRSTTSTPSPTRGVPAAKKPTSKKTPTAKKPAPKKPTGKKK